MHLLCVHSVLLSNFICESYFRFWCRLLSSRTRLRFHALHGKYKSRLKRRRRQVRLWPWQAVAREANEKYVSTFCSKVQPFLPLSARLCLNKRENQPRPRSEVHFRFIRCFSVKSPECPLPLHNCPILCR